MGEERGFKKLSMSCGDNYYGKKQSRKRGETFSIYSYKEQENLGQIEIEGMATGVGG